MTEPIIYSNSITKIKQNISITVQYGCDNNSSVAG